MVRIGFNMLNQIWNFLINVVSNENMNMVWHAIDLQHFMTIILHNTIGVFVQFLPPELLNQTLPTLHRKYQLDVQFCVCVCYRCIEF